MRLLSLRNGILFVVLAGFAVLAWSALSRGFSARSQPGWAETMVARRLRYLAIPRAARDATNPIPATPEVLAEAMAHFADHCAFCHSNDGSGNTEMGQGLYPKAPNMKLRETQGLTDGELFYIIHNGIRFTGMPAFGPQDGSAADADSWKLVHFIRRLPDISDAELELMQTMNPKSPHELEEEEATRRFLEGEDAEPAEQIHTHH